MFKADWSLIIPPALHLQFVFCNSSGVSCLWSLKTNLALSTSHPSIFLRNVYLRNSFSPVINTVISHVHFLSSQIHLKSNPFCTVYFASSISKLINGCGEQDRLTQMESPWIWNTELACLRHSVQLCHHVLCDLQAHRKSLTWDVNCQHQLGQHLAL